MTPAPTLADVPIDDPTTAAAPTYRPLILVEEFARRIIYHEALLLGVSFSIVLVRIIAKLTKALPVGPQHMLGCKSFQEFGTYVSIVGIKLTDAARPMCGLTFALLSVAPVRVLNAENRDEDCEYANNDCHYGGRLHDLNDWS